MELALIQENILMPIVETAFANAPNTIGLSTIGGLLGALFGGPQVAAIGIVAGVLAGLAQDLEG